MLQSEKETSQLINMYTTCDEITLGLQSLIIFIINYLLDSTINLLVHKMSIKVHKKQQFLIFKLLKSENFCFYTT